MNRYFTLLSIAWCLNWAIEADVHAQSLAFQLPTAEERLFELRPSDRLTAVCFLGTECPMARSYVATLNELGREYRSRGVEVVGVMSNHQDSWVDIQRYVEELGAEFIVVKDANHRVADLYGATRTPEVFLLDGQLEVRYHGRIDDRYAPGVARQEASREDLRIAIDQLLAGEPVALKETIALGCIIGKVKASDRVPATSATVTFHEHVVEMLQRNCQTCHRAGEIGPFAMEDYNEVAGWAETMLETIEDGRMPPWHADPQYGDFLNERAMSQQDKQLFRDWIAAGLPKGEQASHPPAPEYVEGWQLPRPPDVVVEMRQQPFVVPSEGVVEYQYFVVDPGFEKDQWVSAAEVVPGNREVVHHAIVFVRPPDGARFSGIGWLSAYVPGQRVFPLPPGRARRIPAGSKFVFQMHYTPIGHPQADVTKVGLLLADDAEITHEVYTRMALDQEFEIPPGAAEHRVSAELREFAADSQLLAITPHMHYRGKSFRLWAEGESQEVLLSVPAYDFNWQHTYQLRQPIELETVRQLRFEVEFDNSAANPFNPDPSARVTWGDQTWEEMAVAFFEVASPRKDRKASKAISTAVQPGSLSPAAEAQIASYVSRALAAMDADGDGQINKSETDIIIRHRIFDQWDLDGNGVITTAELHRVATALYQ